MSPLQVIMILPPKFLFGGMLLYSFCFIAFVFTTLPAERAEPIAARGLPTFLCLVRINQCGGGPPLLYYRPAKHGASSVGCNNNDPRTTSIDAYHKQGDGLWE